MFNEENDGGFVPVETEVKVEVRDFGPVREALVRVGAERVSKVREFNQVYDDKDGGLKREDVLLRLRKDTDIESGIVRVRVTVKGRKAKSKLKQRPEFEVGARDFSAVEKMAADLGLFPARAYEKIRETWHFLGCEVVLDELPFGNYVEIEGDEKAIREAAMLIGLSDTDFITSNYFRLADEKGVSGDIVF